MAAPIKGNGKPNNIPGTPGNDEILGQGGDDSLFGNDGADTLRGGDDDDFLVGGNGFDTLFGNDGNDHLKGNGGSKNVLSTLTPTDVIDGGAGKDTLEVDYDDFFLNGNPNTPYTVIVDISTGKGEAVVSGNRGENFTSIEMLVFRGPDGDDVVTGGKYHDEIRGELGDDTLKGGDGDDLITDVFGDVINADGGKGTDTFQIEFYGGAIGNIKLNAADEKVLLNDVDFGDFKNFENLRATGGGGNDTITGYLNGTNDLGGNSGNDTLTGGNLADRLDGGSGDDTLNGGGGDDDIEDFDGGKTTAHGDAGNDTIGVSAFNGAQTIFGDGGDDIILLALTKTDYTGSSFDGGTDKDAFQLSSLSSAERDLSKATIQNFETLTDDEFSFTPNPTVYKVKMSVEQLTQFSLIKFDAGRIVQIALSDDADIKLAPASGFSKLQLADGGQVADLSGVTSKVHPDVLGGTGDDTITGSKFAESISGGAGLDRLDGGLGKDHLDGGADADTFVFDTKLKANFDTVDNYVVGEDHIELAKSIFKALSLGVLSPDDFHIGAKATDKHQHIIYDDKTGDVSYDADGKGGGAQVHFATLAPGLALTELDFIVT